MVSVAPYREYDGTELSIWLLESEKKEAAFTSSYDNYGYYTEHDFVVLSKHLGLDEKAGKKLIHILVAKISKNLDKAFNSVPGFDDLKSIMRKRIEERIATMSRPWM